MISPIVQIMGRSRGAFESVAAVLYLGRIVKAAHLNNEPSSNHLQIGSGSG